MSAAGNIAWNVCLGWLPGLWYYLLGAILYVTWLFVPIAMDCFRIGKFYFAPFGKEIVYLKDLNTARASLQSNPELAVGDWGETKGGIRKARYAINQFFNFVFLPLNFLGAVLSAPGILMLACTIIFIPIALQALKIMSYSLWPTGRRVVSIELAKRIRDEVAEDVLMK